MSEKKGSGMVGNGDYMLAALKRYFGFDSFRPGQEEAVGAVISGRDVMAVMPTGGGKSVCYQLPAARPGTFTLVVTPLRALMRDQVRHLRSRGIPAALIDSGLDEKERAEVYGRALSGELRILYVAPERLHAPDFADFSHRIRISLLAVDEAHCVLHWGSDFRPSYMRIGEFIDSLSPRPVTMALTATASRTQAGEIRELLHLADPVTVTTDADRPNLRLTVVRARPGERLEAMIAWAKRHKGSGIIYKENRKGCERLAETLRSEGIDAMAFHAEMRDADKKQVQDGFLAGHPRVICATSAFGMGVDKPDVRWVLNDGPCESVESFYQEAGRAGRDGQPARSVMLWTGGDFLNWERRLADSAGNALDDPKDRAKAQNAAFSRLDAMRRYCETDTCRRGLILDYFGDEHDEYCDNCGNCTYVADCDQPTAKRTKTTGTTASRNLNFEEIDATITEFVYDRERMLGFGYGIRKTIRSLMGDTGEGVDDTDIDQLDGYGALTDVDEDVIADRIHRLIDNGTIYVGNYHTLLEP